MILLPSLDLVAFGWADVATKYPCTYPGCLHVFHLRNTLLRHQRLKHGSPRAQPVYSRRSWKLLDKPFSCDHPGCNRSYFAATGLQYHLRHKHWADGVGRAIGPAVEPAAAVVVAAAGAVREAAAVANYQHWHLGDASVKLDLTRDELQ